MKSESLSTAMGLADQSCEKRNTFFRQGMLLPFATVEISARSKIVAMTIAHFLITYPLK